jgi:hypothetical protein
MGCPSLLITVKSVFSNWHLSKSFISPMSLVEGGNRMNTCALIIKENYLQGINHNFHEILQLNFQTQVTVRV